MKKKKGNKGYKKGIDELGGGGKKSKKSRKKKGKHNEKADEK